MLDARWMPLTPSSALSLHYAVERLLRAWLDEVAPVKRVYAPEGKFAGALKLGRLAGWRQGGNGEAADIPGFIVNDAKAFCLEAPQRSALILCSDDRSLAALLRELREAGSQVYLIGCSRQPEPELAREVEPRNIGTLPRLRSRGG